MIQKLQKLKSKRGFSMIELVVVIAIIGILVVTPFVSSSNRNKRISSANSRAADFYSAVQTEFMRFQMFDGPLTMTLAEKYKMPVTSIAANDANGGIKYYPSIGGNYPFAGETSVGETHLDGKPKQADIYLEFYVIGGVLKHADWANDSSTLFSMTGAHTTELGAVLLQEMKDRMEYDDGYYYAKVSYTPPEVTVEGLTTYDYKSRPVKVEWAAYTSNEITSTPTFRTQNVLETGRVCGICGLDSDLGTTGTVLS